MTKPDIVLASASPRRRELLRQIGIDFTVVVSEVDERALTGESPADYVVRLARAKAHDVLTRKNPGLPVLGADTAVVLDGHILCKPGSRNEARVILSRLSGRSHEVHSGVALAVHGGETRVRLNISRVTFAKLEPEWIEAYLQTGDSMDKAGAYGVQGKAAEKISRIEGSFSGVMGLPLYETAELLNRAQVLF